MSSEYWREIQAEIARMNARKKAAEEAELAKRKQAEQLSEQKHNQWLNAEKEKERKYLSASDTLVAIFEDIMRNKPDIQGARLHGVTRLKRPDIDAEYADIYVALKWGEKFELADWEERKIRECRETIVRFYREFFRTYNRSRFPESIILYDYYKIDGRLSIGKNSLTLCESGRSTSYPYHSEPTMTYNVDEFLKDRSIIFPHLVRVIDLPEHFYQVWTRESEEKARKEEIFDPHFPPPGTPQL